MHGLPYRLPDGILCAVGSERECFTMAMYCIANPVRLMCPVSAPRDIGQSMQFQFRSLYTDAAQGCEVPWIFLPPVEDTTGIYCKLAVIEKPKNDSDLIRGSTNPRPTGTKQAPV